MKILMVGDLHGDTASLPNIFEDAKICGAEKIFQLGDFGIWSGIKGQRFLEEVERSAEEYGVPMYFLDGNHENFDILEDMRSRALVNSDGHEELLPGLFYSPRGLRWEWDGVSFMSFGGAASIDRSWREYIEIVNHEPRTLWWPEEMPTQEQVDRIRERPVDVLLSHDSPILPPVPLLNIGRKMEEYAAISRDRLRQVRNLVQPKKLIHGHYHAFATYDDDRIICLNQSREFGNCYAFDTDLEL